MSLPYYEPQPPGLRLSIAGQLNFDAHLHSEIELIYMLAGTGNAYIDETAYPLQKGDLLLVFPNQAHMYFGARDEQYMLCILAPDLLPDSAALLSRCRPENPVLPMAPYRQEVLGRLLEILLLEADVQQQHQQACLHCLRAFFDLLLEKLPLTEASRNDSTLLQSIYDYMRANFREPLSLSLLANQFHISESYAAHLFSDKLKIGFRRYLNALRVNEACVLLQNSTLSVTEVAYACGFSTIRTFNRAFLHEKGLSPRAYRQNNQ